MEQTFLSKTMEVTTALTILFVYCALCAFCPWILAIAFLVIALFIFVKINKMDNTNWEDRL